MCKIIACLRMCLLRVGEEIEQVVETAARKEMISKKERQARNEREAMISEEKEGHDPKKAKNE